jgi:hypothetical protein
MNRLLISITLCVITACHSNSQQVDAIKNPTDIPTGRGEFATQANGLMYSDADIKILRQTVDSLNLRFKTCEMIRRYYACPQQRMYTVTFSSNSHSLSQIRQAIKKKRSFKEVTNSFREYISAIDTLGLSITIGNGKSTSTISGNPLEGYESSYYHSDAEDEEIGNWEYSYFASKENKLDEGEFRYQLRCNYVTGEWKQPIIPEKYARLLQYVDCMVDTSAVVFLTDKYSRGFYTDPERNGQESEITPIMKYICERYKGACNPQAPGVTELQLSYVATELVNDNVFRKLIVTATDNVIAKGTGSLYLEQLADSMGMFDKSLLLKRHRRVMGGCSQDARPRLHALDIARTAGRAHNWDIFLRAHLDIMNDRVDRAIDGSYAWGDRKTYLMELEEINLNVVDLMLGLTMRAANLSDNHYEGTVWRIGWALAESREKDRFEKTAIEMIKDETLDEFNRGLIFLLYRTYTTYLPEKEGQQKRDALRKSANQYAPFISDAIKRMEEPERKR